MRYLLQYYIQVYFVILVFIYSWIPCFFFNKFDHYVIEVALLYMFFFIPVCLHLTRRFWVLWSVPRFPAQGKHDLTQIARNSIFLAKVLMFSQKIMKSEFLVNMHIYISAFLYTTKFYETLLSGFRGVALINCFSKIFNFGQISKFKKGIYAFVAYTIAKTEN